jgi:gas vesicle protein
MAERKESPNNLTIGLSTWADHVEVTENSKHNGIELLFNREPFPVLQSKLRAIGFRPSKVKNMWYSENNQTTKTFALDVQSAIITSPAGPDLILTPSFESKRINIEKKEFSFILITLKDNYIKNYVVFEPSKPKAEVIATKFAREHFGDNFSGLAVKPRTQIREARILFDEGKIILPIGQQTIEEKPTKNHLPVSSEAPIPESLETAADKTRELEQITLQKFYRWAPGREEFRNKTDDVRRNLFNNWLKENAPELDETSIENMWRSHQRITKSMNRIQKRGDGLQPYSTIYKKLLQVIPDLIKHLEEGTTSGKSVKDPKGGLMDLHFDYLGKDKKGNYLIALSHYFKQNGDLVPDPDMQIRILPEMEVAEAMTYQDQFGHQEVYPDQGDGKEYVNLRRKKELNKFLSQWLSNIIRQGHKIDLNPNNKTESSELNSDIIPISDYPMLPIVLPEEEETIEQYLDKGFKIPFSAQEAFDKNLPVIDLAFRSVPAVDHFHTQIEIPLQQQIQELQKELKGLQENNRERKTALKNEIENLQTEIRISEKLIEDETMIFQEGLFRILLEKANQKGYYNKVKSNLSNFRDYMLTNLLDNRAIENYSTDGVQNVAGELLEEYVGAETGNSVLKAEVVSSATPISTEVKKQATPKTKKQNQREVNEEIESLIDSKDRDKDFFNEEDKNRIRQYSGSGGLIKQGATGKGVLYEYYTADTIIKKMWDIAYHYGYDGGAVLEPSVGTGNFLKYGPKGSAIVGYEINHYAARIAQILYPAAQIHEAPFETIFFAGNIHLKDDFADNRYSLVIGNPPYGEFSGRYAGMGEKKWTGASQYEHYFTLRGLDLLKSGGLLIYIVPSNFLRGSSFSTIAEKIAAKCIGLDRYCLGTGIFKTTDIETDIIALRKN